MDRDGLIAHEGAVAAVRDKAGDVGREAGKEGFQDEDGGGFVGVVVVIVVCVGVVGFGGVGVVRIWKEFCLSA